MKWPWIVFPSFFSIFVNVFINTFNESMLESFINFVFSPWINFLGHNFTTSGFFDGLKSFFFFLSPINKFLNMIAIL